MWKESQPFVRPAQRKCLQRYCYFLDRKLGLIHAPTPDGRSVRPFNPVAPHDRTLFEVLMSGEHLLHGFTNRDLREKLGRAAFPLAPDPAKHSGQVTRLLRRLHVHQLIAKIPRSRRWRVSLQGRRVMAAAVKLREVAYPRFYAHAA